MDRNLGFNRRQVLSAAAATLATPWALSTANRLLADQQPATKFQIACMTLPYSQYPLARALEGIKSAGFRFVAWYTSHREVGESKPVPVIAADDPPTKAKDLGDHCRGMGLAPVLMFSGIYPEAANGVEVLTNRLKQAAAAKIPHVLTFGHTDGQNRKLWVDRFKQLGPIASDLGVVLVVKQHGETGQVTGEIVREVDHSGIRVNYDAGNVMDYTKGQVNPLDDIKTCADLIHSFCIKDHRMFPVNQDCGPGLGEIDHYRLLANVAFTGREMPLACENISAPKIRPTNPEQIDSLARRAREFLELVTTAITT